MAETTLPAGDAAYAVRSITGDDLRWALREGWSDYQHSRGELLLLPLVYALVGVLAGFVAFNADLFPFFFPLAAGFALVGPVAAAGFYELARRREAGEPSDWSHFFDPMKGRARWPLISLTIMLAGLFGAWLWVAGAIYGATLATLGQVAPGEFLMRLFSTPEGIRMVVLGNAVGAVFALLALVLSAFSFPLVVDKAADPLTAVMTSVQAFARNPLTVLQWGAIVALILLLACIPLFIGLIIALPVLGYATWHLYTRTVVR